VTLIQTNSAGQSHDDEGIEQAEAKGWGNE